MKNLKRIIIASLFILAALLISHHIFLNDMFFDSDIGRDFLLIDDVVSNRNITLIGPRADGISGMFFGPHWIYLNIPFYLIGNGNPVVVAFSWVLLILFSIISTYYVANKLFGKTSGLIAAMIYAFFIVPFSTGITQSFFAVLISPWIVYFLALFIKNKKPLYLGISLFLSGTLYQFQPAFGMITIPFTVLITFYEIVKIKKYKYLLLYIFLVIPFGLFIVSELKSNFLQTNAFISHIFIHSDTVKKPFFEVLNTRLQLLIEIFNLSQVKYFALFFIGIFIYIYSKILKEKESLYKNYYIIYLVYVVGFFVISFLFKGRFNEYHVWGFLPLTIIAISGLNKFVKNKNIYLVLMIAILIIGIAQAFSFKFSWTNNFHNKDFLSWQANDKIAKYIFQNENSNFSYYIYSFDEFGYSMRYAMKYNDRLNIQKTIFCEKQIITYLIYGPGPTGKFIEKPDYWKVVRVGIKKDPVSSKKIGEFLVEKYKLDENDLKVKTDPNLICNLHFR